MEKQNKNKQTKVSNMKTSQIHHKCMFSENSLSNKGNNAKNCPVVLHDLSRFYTTKDNHKNTEGATVWRKN